MVPSTPASIWAKMGLPEATRIDLIMSLPTIPTCYVSHAAPQVSGLSQLPGEWEGGCRKGPCANALNRVLPPLRLELLVPLQ